MSKPVYDPPNILVRYLVAENEEANTTSVNSADARADVQFMYRLFDMQKIVRFFGQRYWEKETNEDLLKPGELLLETVAAHSFQVASSVRWLAPHFHSLDHVKAVDLALLHDQPEIFTGDRDPVGTDGQGFNTHAFNTDKRNQKENDERAAVDVLAAVMRQSMRGPYRALVDEYLNGVTNEAKFVKAVDKLQALVFVRLKKFGNITPEHMAFTIRYSRLGVLAYPAIQLHFQLILRDILSDVSLATSDEFPAYCKLTQQILEASNA
jgi:5'-deoxynucleotidase YfbR-like HD superfamily hydrolase